MNKPLLRVENVYKNFLKNKAVIEVLKDVTFELGEAEIVSIMGASGVGKSTLLHILGSLEPPSKGQVFFGEQNIWGFGEKKQAQFRNRNMGFIFQFHYLLAEFSALENVMMPALIAGVPKRTAEKQAFELLEATGLSERVKHRPAELSGGEQQRVAIARAMVMRPKLILADEPTGNLDTVNKDLIMNLLLEFNRREKISMLLVTHDQTVAEKTHRVLNLKEGRLTP